MMRYLSCWMLLLLLLFVFFNVSTAKRKSNVKGAIKRRQLGVGFRPPFDDDKDEQNNNKKDKKTSLHPSLAPTLNSLHTSSPPTKLLSPTIPASSSASAIPTNTPTALPSAVTFSPSSIQSSPSNDPVSSTFDSDDDNDDDDGDDQQQLPEATTNLTRSLLPFNITFQQGANADDSLDRRTITLALEYFLFSHLHAKWNTLHSIHLVESSSDETMSTRQNLQLEEQVIVSYSSGRAIFRTTTTSNISRSAGAGDVPTTQQVHDAQRQILLALTAELQLSLQDNGILWNIQDISLGGNNHTETSTIIPNDDSDATALTASWVTLLSAVLLTSMACVVYRRRLQHAPPSRDTKESSAEIKIPEVLLEDDAVVPNKNIERSPATMTWENLMQSSFLVYSMENNDSDQDAYPPSLHSGSNAMQTEYMTVAQPKEREVVHLQSTRPIL
jgi:hypothetical protein